MPRAAAQPAATKTTDAAADPALVLSKATGRVAEALGMSNRALAQVIGCSEATVSRLRRGKALPPATKEGELALLLVRLFRSLDAIVGGDVGAARQWFEAPNAALGGAPAERVRSVEGLVAVVRYLDAMRART